MTREPALTRDAFQQRADVSRETTDRLQRYADLLTKWQRAINLVGRDSLADLWRRHMLDSAQLLPLLPRGAKVLVDFGSGAGFPGLVLAVLGVPEVHLVESDARKCAFLREAARVTGVADRVHIHTARLEKLRPWAVDVITARALADLSTLLAYAEPFLGPETVCLFLKGGKADEELTGVAKEWKMAVSRHPSVADPSGVVLRLDHIARDTGFVEQRG